MGRNDTSGKTFFRNPVNFADVCNGILFAGRQMIKPEELSDMESHHLYLDREQDKEIAVDVAKKWSNGDVVFSLLIIENQTNVDYGMVVRNMISESLCYGDQIKNIRNDHDAKKDLKTSAEFLSGLSKTDRLTPIITLIIYYGNNPWDGAQSLYELIGGVESDLAPYISNYRLNLFDYHDRDNFEEFTSEVRLLFQTLAAQGDKVKIKQVFTGENEDISAETMRLIGGMIGVRDMEKYIEKKEGQDMQDVGHMCKALQDIYQDGVDAGIERGIEQGIEQGQGLAIRRMLMKNYPDGEIIDLMDCSQEMIDRIKAEINENMK